MSSSPAPATLGVYSLSEKEQRVKLRKRQEVEKHWQCAIDHALPRAIRPRLTGGKGHAKAKIGHQVPEAEWWRWSSDFFYKLQNLAAMTPGRLPFAQALMQAEVAQRQQDYTNPHREAAELLTQDLGRIVTELQSRAKGGSDTDEEGYEDDSEDDANEANGDEQSREEGGRETDGLESPNGQDEYDQTIRVRGMKDEETADRPIKSEPNMTPIKRKASEIGDIPAAKRRSDGPSSQSQASKEALETRANIASLRAAAARLRQQASQREAKAYKLEAELYEKEAGEAE